MNSNNKALVLVPHQDDDIIMMGNIFNIINNKYEVYVVFSSLDRNPTMGKTRKKEACDGLSVFGIEQDHISFLEYPDMPPHSGKHFFAEGDKTIISDLIDTITRIRPSIIFAVDYDKHWDHKMLSLAFEEAMGILLKQDPSYCPIVLKGFCYETGCLGIEDYKASTLEPTTIKGEIRSNPSFEWNNRISIYGNNKSGFIWNSPVYKALAKHKSQGIKLFSKSIINLDSVFWIRRTDNKILHAEISSDTGDVSKLNDFMILDTTDLDTSDTSKVDFSKGVWKGSHSSVINIKWKEKVSIDRLIFHGNPNQKSDQNIIITVSTSENKVCCLNTLRAYGRNTEVRFDPILTDNLCIELDSNDTPIELSEIEAFYGDYDIGILYENTIEPKLSVSNNKLLDSINNLGFKLIYYKEKILQKLKL